MTTKFILNEVAPAFYALNAMIHNGTIQINAKVVFALGKNYGKIKRVQKAHNAFRDDLLQEHVHFDGKVPKTVQVEGKPEEWDFLSPEHKKQFLKKINEFGDEEITLEGGWHKISEEDLKEVHNFPMDVFAALDEAGMLTSIHMAGADLKIIN
jgi:hypothetical protein